MQRQLRPYQERHKRRDSILTQDERPRETYDKRGELILNRQVVLIYFM